MKDHTGFFDKHNRQLCVGDTVQFIVGDSPDSVFYTGKVVRNYADGDDGHPYVVVPAQYVKLGRGHWVGGYFGPLGRNNYDLSDIEIVAPDTPLGTAYEDISDEAV